MVSFSYDSKRRLIQAGTTVYTYDAENHRIGVNGTRFVVNSQPALSQVLMKTAVDGTQTFYVYGLGLIGEESAAGYKAYHFDYRGSTVALSDASGAVSERFSYSAYGVLLSGDATLTPFLFNGQYGVMTDGNGLYHMRARFYSAEIRRFLNRDVLLGSVAEGQSLNRFAYVTGRPVSLIDPTGLVADYAWDIPVIIYDIYYGVAEGDWSPLAIDLPLALAPGVPAGAGAISCGIRVSKKLAPSKINFSQRTVSGNVEQYVRDMMTGKWDWSKSGPIRIMKQNGQWVSYDNRRLMAAQQAGLPDIPFEVVDPKSLMPGSKKTWEQAFNKRFNDQRNVDAGGAVPPGGLSTQPSITP